MIDTPADILWHVISDFGAAEKYLSGVLKCKMEGAGLGALRTLTNTDRSTVVERLETMDGDAHQLSYVLLTDTPFRNCITSIAVCGRGVNQAEVAWSVTFQADGIPISEAVEMLRGILESNSRSLKRFMER